MGFNYCIILYYTYTRISISHLRFRMSKTKRNGDILKNFKKEIDLSTKVVKSKKNYSRKQKYKGNYNAYSD